MSLLLQIFIAFAKVGLFGYGGGPSMIPLVEKEVVDVHHWLTTEEFVDALAMGNSLPGPIVIKMSAFVGYKLAGLPGVLCGVVGVSFPSLVLMLILSALFLQFKDQPKVQATLKAVRPAVVALLALIIYDVFPQSVRSWDTFLIAAIAFVIVAFLKIHPALVILGAAILGLLIY
ncbi:MAG: chromate transporter [Anaerolineae bacterium]